MSKVFGYSGNDGQHWFSSDAYSDNEIENILDPEGGSGINMPTAIPSPFARMDVVRTAFSNISNTKWLKAESHSEEDREIVIASRYDERLVSHTLDLLELLFNRDNFPDQLEIIMWDKVQGLKALENGLPEHKRYAQTLQLYLKQDASVYNFNEMRALYLLRFNYQIIGCTSPCTLFFPTANPLDFAQVSLTTSDVLFDETYCPLYQRDDDFQRYVHRLFKAYPLLKSRMPAVAEYIDKSLNILGTKNVDLFHEFSRIQVGDFKGKYEPVDTGVPGQHVEIFQIPLYKHTAGDVEDSDFFINSSKEVKTKPLVLQDNLNAPLRYVKDKWDPHTKVPNFDPNHLEQRFLPGVKRQYPYLTVSDFLEPYLIRLVYPINNSCYFDGNYSGPSGSDGYLLPLKRRFFDYFTPDDLLTAGPEKPSIKMEAHGNSIKVVLKVPIQKNNVITYERIYHPFDEKTQNEPSEADNKGVILQQEFGVSLFPFLKTNDAGIAAHYRVHVVDRDVAGYFQQNDYHLSFFSSSAHEAIPIESQQPRVRFVKNNLQAGSKFYVLKQEFDYIQIHNNWAYGILMPRWPKFQSGNAKFTFAIDFGTTNTHIEYKTENIDGRPFDITRGNPQVATLFDPDKTNFEFPSLAIRESTDHELIPAIIGDGSEYRFPQRTVLAERGDLDIRQSFALADFNIPFTYERKNVRDTIHANLKWAKTNLPNDTRVERFLENLILMIRTKILQGGGSLKATELIWFYPSSMGRGRIASLRGVWDRLCKEYFGVSVVPKEIPESLAPFYYYKQSQKLPGGSFKPAVSIDIGGGTTDVVIFKNEEPLLLTSFKFAANTIFGDGFTSNGASTSHGIISKYVRYFDQVLNKGDLRDLAGVLASLKSRNRSEDIGAFLFSVANSSKVADKSTSLYSFNQLLSRDEDLKIIFLYFYSAIIYHVAELMKSNGIDLPSGLVFSGTGSKILKIITESEEDLAGFSKLIFSKVFEKEFDEEGLTIHTTPQPKEITSKGGLVATDFSINVNEIKTVFTSLEKDGINELSWEMVKDNIVEDLAEHVSIFNSFFVGLNNEFNFNDNFNISKRSLSLFREHMNKHLRDYLISGVKFNRTQNEIESGDETIGETLFFYPITGVIGFLSSKLAQLEPEVSI